MNAAPPPRRRLGGGCELSPLRTDHGPSTSAPLPLRRAAGAAGSLFRIHRPGPGRGAGLGAAGGAGARTGMSLPRPAPPFPRDTKARGGAAASHEQRHIAPACCASCAASAGRALQLPPALPALPGHCKPKSGSARRAESLSHSIEVGGLQGRPRRRRGAPGGREAVMRGYVSFRERPAPPRTTSHARLAPRRRGLG